MSFFPQALAEPAAALLECPVEWEEPGCLLCGSRRWSHLIEAPDHVPGGGGLWFAVAQCQDCGLCFTSPRPSQRSIQQFYPSNYFPDRAPSPRQRKGPRQPTVRKWWPSRNIRRTVRWHGEGRLLDFGCGGGSFLERMHRQGWKVTGLDSSPAAVQRVRGELGLPALVGSLPHEHLHPESFDVITMWQSLEHVHQPREVLRSAYDLLVPGGKLYVAVPNIDSLPFQWYRHHWFGLDLPRHLTHFAPKTLQWMLERSGFDVPTLRMVRQTSWLRNSARLARHDRRVPLWRRWCQTKLLSRLMGFYSCLTYQADCILAVAVKNS